MPPLGIALEGINYPYPVQYLDPTLEGQPVRMTYMDVPPSAAPKTIPRKTTQTTTDAAEIFTAVDRIAAIKREIRVLDKKISRYHRLHLHGYTRRQSKEGRRRDVAWIHAR
ncbi:hypothetical protein [Bradyrhizobium uaiense]|uniref:hypothetical protein n=1 Tax=Bradyrhizobium uaiense TaxID=2594946 RepID=UPI0019D57D0C|nr:hypothetical protein [Bradyrhizobium uaiense]